MIFILSSISRGLAPWSVNHASIYEHSESNFFKNITFSGEISNNWLNGLLGTNVYNRLGFYWKLLLTTMQFINTTSVISK